MRKSLSDLVAGLGRSVGRVCQIRLQVRGLSRPSAALEKFASRFDGTGALLAAGLAAGIVIAVASNSRAETRISGEQAEGVRPWWREMLSNAGPALIVFVLFVLSSGVLTRGLGVAGLAVEGIKLSFQTAPEQPSTTFSRLFSYASIPSGTRIWGKAGWAPSIA